MSSSNQPSGVHAGRPLVRPYANGGRVMILCPRGHVVQTIAASDYPASILEQRVSDPTYTVDCKGA